MNRYDAMDGSGSGNASAYTSATDLITARNGWRYFILLMILLPMVVGSCYRASPEQGEPIDVFAGHLEEVIPEWMERYDIPGVSVTIIVEGKISWSRAYGYADRERNRRMTPDAVFRAESISKSVTAWGVMKLVDQGRIGIDDPVQPYLNGFELPESEFTPDKVTVRRLLSNSAGMPLGTLGEEYATNETLPSLQEYLAREAHLVQEPGAGFLYSNTGYNLLELLIEKITGRNFAEYMAGEVLAPLSMDRSGYAWDDSLFSALATGYDLKGRPVPPYLYAASASGGLLADARDIARYVSAGMTDSYYMDRGVLSRESIRRIHAPHVNIPGMYGAVADAYGFGHFIEELPDGRRAVWHGGQGHGWMTHFHAVPQSGEGIVILTNSQRSWPFIARILGDWSRWRGFGPVKFSRIARAVSALRIVNGFILAIALLGAWRIIYGIATRRRTFKLSPGYASGSRAAALIGGLALLGVLAWSVSQKYLFITYLFPVGSVWLGWSLLLLSLVLVASALWPDDRLHNSNT